MERATFFNMHSGIGGELATTRDGAKLRVFRGDRVVATTVVGDVGNEGRPHSHPQEQWTLVVRGSCRFELDGVGRKLGVLDVVEIPPYAPHHFAAGSDDVLLLSVFERAGLGKDIPGEAEPDWTVAPPATRAAVSSRVFNMRHPDGALTRKLAEGMYSNIFASDRLMVSVVRIEPNCKGKLHNHPHEQWGVLIEGSGKRIAEYGFTPVDKGDFWFTPGEELHTFEAGPAGALILEVFSPPREDYLKP